MTLSARSSGIISLEGLQYAVNLKYLDLCGNAIEDLTPIRDLREIEVLNLSKNMLRDIQALREFRQLLRLDISRNNLYTMDISALAGMINLEELNLERSKVDKMCIRDRYWYQLCFAGFYPWTDSLLSDL